MGKLLKESIAALLFFTLCSTPLPANATTHDKLEQEFLNEPTAAQREFERVTVTGERILVPRIDGDSLADGMRNAADRQEPSGLFEPTIANNQEKVTEKITVQLTEEDIKFLNKLIAKEQLAGIVKGLLVVPAIEAILLGKSNLGKTFSFNTTDWIGILATGPSDIELIKACAISRNIALYMEGSDLGTDRGAFFGSLHKGYAGGCS